MSKRDDFWASTPILTHIRRAADSRGRSAEAVLAAVLVRRITALPPNYVLPPLVGTDASANLYVVLCAASGGGKGSTSGIASSLLPDTLMSGAIGSAEALPKAFARRDKDSDDLVWQTRHFLAAFDEVSTLYANQSRSAGSGDGMAGVLNSAWIGEPVGQMYSDRMKSVPLESQTYRLGLLIGLQNRIAGQLLRTEVNGFAQRCLFVPATGDVCHPARRPSWPGVLQLPELKRTTSFGDEDTDLSGRRVIRLPDEVQAEIIEHDYQVQVGERQVNPLDTHRMLLQEKVAVGFALLRPDSFDNAGDLTVTIEDWQHSMYLLAIHDEMRVALKEAARAEAEASAQAAGKLDGIRAAAADHQATAFDVDHYRTKMLDKLRDAGPLNKKSLLANITSKKRPEANEALRLLVETGAVILDGGRYQVA